MANTYLFQGGTHINADPKSNIYFTTHHNSNADSEHGPFNQLARHTTASALYDAADNIEVARCHPGTRQTVLRRLAGYLDPRSGDKARPIVWLSGSAGVGKSAIMRSLCEDFFRPDGYVLASFFFFRTDASRNTTQAFVPTLALQLCRALPSLRPYIERSITLNPLIFSQSLRTQGRQLLIDPILAFCNEQPDSPFLKERPGVVIVDGLDECADVEERRQLLDLLHILATTIPHFPIRILIASRPERDITEVFDSNTFQSVVQKEYLNLDGDVHADIRKFYRDKFEEIRRYHPMTLPDVWPPPEVLDELLEQTDGQFAFGTTVIRFVQPDTSNPVQRLRIMMGALPPGQYKPFERLDALYRFIFSLIEEERLQHTLIVLGLVLNVFQSVSRTDGFDAVLVEDLLGLESGRCRQLLLGLESLIAFPPKGQGGAIGIFHKSICDFLIDQSRSGRLFVAEQAVCDRLVKSFVERRFWFTYVEAPTFVKENAEAIAQGTSQSEEVRDIISNVDFTEFEASIRPHLEGTLKMSNWFVTCEAFVMAVDKAHYGAQLKNSFRNMMMPRLSTYFLHPDLRLYLCFAIVGASSFPAIGHIRYPCGFYDLTPDLYDIEHRLGLHLTSPFPFAGSSFAQGGLVAQWVQPMAPEWTESNRGPILAVLLEILTNERSGGDSSFWLDQFFQAILEVLAPYEELERGLLEAKRSGSRFNDKTKDTIDWYLKKLARQPLALLPPVADEDDLIPGSSAPSITRSPTPESPVGDSDGATSDHTTSPSWSTRSPSFDMQLGALTRLPVSKGLRVSNELLVEPNLVNSSLKTSDDQVQPETLNNIMSPKPKFNTSSTGSLPDVLEPEKAMVVATMSPALTASSSSLLPPGRSPTLLKLPPPMVQAPIRARVDAMSQTDPYPEPRRVPAVAMRPITPISDEPNSEPVRTRIRVVDWDSLVSSPPFYYRIFLAGLWVVVLFQSPFAVIPLFFTVYHLVFNTA